VGEIKMDKRPGRKWGFYSGLIKKPSRRLFQRNLLSSYNKRWYFVLGSKNQLEKHSRESGIGYIIA